MTSEVSNTIRQLVAADDPQALAVLYDELAASLYGYLVTQLGRREHADEALQRVFLNVARHRRKLLAARSLEDYVFGMTRNVVVDYRRELGRQAAPPADGETVVAVNDDDGHPDAETSAALSRGLAALPEAQREVVCLKYYGRLTFAQIAERLGIPLDTAASRCRYALEKLREYLSEKVNP